MPHENKELARMEHLIADLRKGYRGSQTDKTELRELIERCCHLLAIPGQDELIGAVMLLVDGLIQNVDQDVTFDKLDKDFFGGELHYLEQKARLMQLPTLLKTRKE